MTLLEGKQIFLTGFMATGKTKVGRILAERLGRPFVDTDNLIVATAGKSIPEIFDQDGEDAFRRIEHDGAFACHHVPGNHDARLAIV